MTAEVLENVVASLFLIMSISLLLQRDFWVSYVNKVMEDISKLMGLMFFMLPFGLYIIYTHNFWILDWPVVITIFGWLIVIKATIYFIMPSVFTDINFPEAFIKRVIPIEGCILAFLCTMVLLSNGVSLSGLFR